MKVLDELKEARYNLELLINEYEWYELNEKQERYLRENFHTFAIPIAYNEDIVAFDKSYKNDIEYYYEFEYISSPSAKVEYENVILYYADDDTSGRVKNLIDDLISFREEPKES